MDVQDIKNIANITTVINHFNVKKANGSGYSYHCPFHEDKSASFIAKENQHNWRCTVCDIGGDEIEFIQKINNCSKGEAINKLKDIFNIPKEITKLPLTDLQEIHFKLLLDRGIKATTAKELGYKTIVPNSGDKPERNTRIYFPEKRNGFIESYKYINIANKKDQGVDGLDREAKLFPDYDLKDISTLIIVCGQWDQAIMYQLMKEDYPDKLKTTKIVCMSSGELSIPPDIDRLKQYKQSLNKIFYFCDGDKAGEEAGDKWADTITKLGFDITLKKFPEELRLKQKDGKLKLDVNDAYLHKGFRIKQLFELPEQVFKANEALELELPLDDKQDVEIKKEINSIKKTFYENSSEIQKAILNYLIVNNYEFKNVKNNLKEELFLDYNCRNIYSIFVERMNSISVFNFDKLKEVNEKGFKYLLSCKIEVLNKKELDEKIKQLDNCLQAEKINHYRNKLERLAEHSYISTENDKTIVEIGLDYAALFQEMKNQKKVETTLYDAKHKLIRGELDEGELLDISKFYPQLNTLMGGGIAYGKMHLLAGRPSTGKTTFITGLLEFIAQSHKIGLYELEMKPYEIAQQSFARTVEGKTLGNFKKYLYYQDIVDTMKLKTFEHDKNFKIYNNYRTPVEIIQDMKMRVETEGIRIFALDHFHRLQILADKRFGSEIEARNHYTRMFTDFCDAYNVILLMLCQMNRGVESRSGADVKPKQSDLKGTGALEEDAYTIGFLYSPEGTQKNQSSDRINFLLSKARGGIAGTEIEFYYRRARALFQEMEYTSEEEESYV